jgi:DNA-binding response OmpR family regulator
LIDDEVDLQQLVQMTLQVKGYHVEVANNGIEGLQKLKSFHPDLIILDMNMPEMGGLEFYQRISVNDKPEYPVLVLTARANMEKLFRQFNIDGFMAKPFEIDELLKEVSVIIEKYSNRGIDLSAGVREPREVCIVDNDAETLNKIGLIFLNAGYIVDPAQNGVEGIERIAHRVPDVALIKLGLVDISGDIVVLKLRNMAKTRDVKYILYTQGTSEKRSVAQIIGQKEGIDRFVEFTKLEDLFEAAKAALKE